MDHGGFSSGGEDGGEPGNFFHILHKLQRDLFSLEPSSLSFLCGYQDQVPEDPVKLLALVRKCFGRMRTAQAPFQVPPFFKHKLV